jgi:hypothetical protein
MRSRCWISADGMTSMTAVFFGIVGGKATKPARHD